MERTGTVLLVISLARALLARKIWCGEAQLQAAVALLETDPNVPWRFPFVRLKGSAYSFELHDELVALFADHLLEVRVERPLYGPQLRPTCAAHALAERFPKTTRSYRLALAPWLDELADTPLTLDVLATAHLLARNSDGSVEEHVRALRHARPRLAPEIAALTIDAVRRPVTAPAALGPSTAPRRPS